MFSASTFGVRPELAMAKTLHGLTLELNLFYKTKKNLYKDCQRSNTKIDKKLINISKSCKAHWSLLRRLLNNFVS